MVYTVVLIEPRKHKALDYVIRNALDNLDERWNLLIFHGTKNKEYLDNIVTGLADVNQKRITFRDLYMDNLDYEAYCSLLTSPYFYRSLPTEILLFIQTDSMIIPRNKNNIYHFLEYNYVGAPWSGGAHTPLSSDAVGNGGFSLRNRSAMIRLLDEHPYKPMPGGEDCHISKYEKNKPSLMKALEFSTESLLWESFGLHAPWKYIQMKYLEDKFPFIHELIALQGVEEEGAK
jgi:hypothetical protein